MTIWDEIDHIFDQAVENGEGSCTFSVPGEFSGYRGHFPGNPIMPGVFILEAMAQVGGIAMLYPEENRGKIALFGGMEKIKFKKQVIPGDQLVMKAHIVNIVKKNFGKLHADAYVEDTLAATADFIFALKKPENSAN